MKCKRSLIVDITTIYWHASIQHNQSSSFPLRSDIATYNCVMHNAAFFSHIHESVWTGMVWQHCYLSYCTLNLSKMQKNNNFHKEFILHLHWKLQSSYIRISWGEKSNQQNLQIFCFFMKKRSTYKYEVTWGWVNKLHFVCTISCFSNFKISFPVLPLVEAILLCRAAQTNRVMLKLPPGKSTYKWLAYSTLSQVRRKHFTMEKKTNNINMTFKEYIK